MNKRQTHPNALRIGINLGLVVVILVLGVLIFQWIQPKEPPLEREQTYTVTLDDYRYYQLDDVDYGFVLARIKLSSNQLFTVDLQSMITHEQIKLSDTLLYTAPLTEAGYRLSCPGADEVSGLSANICVFIPVLNTQNGELVLKVNLDRPYNLSFNLRDEQHHGTKAMLGVDELISTYNASILSYRTVSTRSFTIVDSEGATVEAPFNSQSRVLGFQLRIQPLNSSTVIETATLSLLGYGTFQLVNPEYTNDEADSLIGVNFTTSGNGYLFFEITNPDIDLSALDPSSMTLSVRAAGETAFVVALMAP